ncbi:MAG TPA: SAM-dependent methyltransferase [Polyangiales bacterium]|jgi:tRNA-Thr(GGU) m(6)t(6)A37 methyltransferase TsaA
MASITVTPIGTVRSSRREVADDDWDREQVHVELDPEQLPPEALLGVDSFSHVEVLFYMDQVRTIERAARHPRNNSAWPKVGILAQRGKNRPNQIGSTVCRVLRVEGGKLFVEGLDAVDGSPVLDIKPWVREFAPRGAVVQPPWIGELMRGYWSAPADEDA